jgi:hypothetical protein
LFIIKMTGCFRKIWAFWWSHFFMKCCGMCVLMAKVLPIINTLFLYIWSLLERTHFRVRQNQPHGARFEQVCISTQIKLSASKTLILSLEFKLKN